MKNFNISVKEHNVDNIPSILRDGVRNFNKPFLGDWPAIYFAICIEDEGQNLIGGISGYYFNEYVLVQWASVDEAYRKTGIGTRLFNYLDEFALSKNCKFIHLETMEFQARKFYEKFGFVVEATIPDWFNGYAIHIMRKKL